MYFLRRELFCLTAFLVLHGSYVAHTGTFGQHTSETLKSESGLSEDVRCTDIFTCVNNNHEKQEQMNAKGREEACRILTATYKCVRSALTDCQRQTTIQAEPMQTISSYVRKMDERLKKFCMHIYKDEILGTTVAFTPAFQPTEMMAETYTLITTTLPKTSMYSVRNSRFTDVTCEDIKSCSQDLGEVQALMNARQVNAGCSLLFDAYQCFKSATVNCKARRLRSPAVVRSLEHRYRRMEGQLSHLCSIIFEPEDKSCEAIKPCLDGLNPIGEFISSGSVSMACNFLVNARKCLQKASADCKTRGLINAQDLQAIDSSYQTVEEDLARFCTLSSTVPSFTEQSRSSLFRASFSPSASASSLTIPHRTKNYVRRVRCNDVEPCFAGHKGITELVFSKGHHAACKVLPNAHECVQSAISHCEMLGISSLKAVKLRYRIMLNQLERYCAIGSEDSRFDFETSDLEREDNDIPTNTLVQTDYWKNKYQYNVRCEDIAICLGGFKGIRGLVFTRGYVEACNVLSHAYGCLKAVTLNCKKRGMTNALVRSIKIRYRTKLRRLNRFCTLSLPEVPEESRSKEPTTVVTDTPTRSTSTTTSSTPFTSTSEQLESTKANVIICGDITPCLNGYDGIHELVNARGYREACQVLPNAYKCLDLVMMDCRRRRLSTRALTTARTQYLRMFQQLERYCSTPAPVTKLVDETSKEETTTSDIPTVTTTILPTTTVRKEDVARCRYIAPCLSGHPGIREFVIAKGYQATCSILPSLHKCLDEVTADCQKRRVQEAEIQSTKTRHRMMVDQLERYCTTRAPVTRQLVQTSTESDAIDLIVPTQTPAAKKLKKDVTNAPRTSPSTTATTEPPSSTLFSGFWEELEKPVGESAKCEDITKCLHGFNRIGQLPYGGYQSVCSLLFNAYKCMKSATVDCATRDLKRTEILQSLESHNKAMRDELTTFCPSYTIAPRPVTQSEMSTSETDPPPPDTTQTMKTTLDYRDCKVISSCLANYDQVDKLISSGDTYRACSVMWNAYECSKLVAAKCTDHGVLSDEDLLAAGVNLKTMKEKIDLYCPEVVRETTTERSTNVQSTDIPWIWQNNDIDDVKCENASLCTNGYNRIAELFSSDGYFRACSIMLNAYYCLRSASMDCANRKTEDVSVRSMRLKYTVMEDRITRFCPSYLHVTTLTTTPEPLEISTMFDVKCLEINSCYRNFRRIAELMTAKEYDESCRYMHDAYWCFRSALADCRQRGMMAGQALHSIQLSFNAMEKQMNIFCPKTTPAATTSRPQVTSIAAMQSMYAEHGETSTIMTISCEGILLCSEVINRFGQLLDSEAYDSACRLRSNIYDCLKSAVTDCESRGIMNIAALQSVEASYRNIENQAYKFCPAHPTDSALLFQPGMLGRETMLRNFSFLSKASDRRSDSPFIFVKCEGITFCLEGLKRSEEYLGLGRYGVACSLMKYTSECLKSAKLDCQERGAMDQEALQTVEMSAQGMEIQVTKYCPEARHEELGWIDFDVDTASTLLSTASVATSMEQKTPTENMFASESIVTSPKLTVTATTAALSTDKGAESTKAVANVKCEDVVSCLQGLRNLDQLKSVGREVVCRAVSSSYQCMTSALSDCKSRALLTGATLQSVEMSLRSIEKLMRANCVTTPPDEWEFTSAHTEKLPETEIPTKTSTTAEQQTSTADEGTQCEEVTSCLSGLNKVGGLRASGQEDTACNLMSDAYKCLKSAVSDCKKRGIMSTSAIQTIEMSYTSMEDQISSVCPTTSRSLEQSEPTAATNVPQNFTTTAASIVLTSESTDAPNVKCEDVTVCLKDLNQISNVMATEGNDGVCRLMSRAYHCLKSVVSDCRSSGIMDAAAFQTIEMSYRSMEGQMASMCPDIIESSRTRLEATSPMTKPTEIIMSYVIHIHNPEVKCEDVTSCLEDLSQVVAPSGSYDNTCSLMFNAYQCLTSAIADCKNRKIISGEAMQSLEMSYKTVEDQVKRHCPSAFPESTVSEALSPDSAATEPSSGVASTNPTFASSETMKSTTAKNVKCEEIVSCTVDTRLIGELIASGKSGAACSLMYDAYHCVKTAVMDCENNGLLYGTALQSVEATYKGIEEQTNKYCAHSDAASSTMTSEAPTTPTATLSSENTTSIMTTVSAEATTTPMPTDSTSLNVRCEDAMSCLADTSLEVTCSLMSDAVQCLRAAVLDCRRQRAVNPIALQAIKRSYRTVQRRFASKCTTTTASPQEASHITFSTSTVTSVVTNFANVYTTTERPKEEEVSTLTSVKCQNIMSCVERAMQVQQLSISEQRIEVCSLLSDAVVCMKSAISDCREKGMSHHGLRSLETTLRSAENQRSTLCSTSSTGAAQKSTGTQATTVRPDTITPTIVATEPPISSLSSTSTEAYESSRATSFRCEELQSCVKSASDINQYLASGRLNDACSAMSKAHQCMKLSISDCRDRKLMPSSMLQSLEISAKTIEDEMKRQCVTEVPTQPSESTNAGVNVKTSTTKSSVTESLITPKLPVSTEKEEDSSLIEVKCEELQSCVQQAIGIDRLLASNQNDAACSAMSKAHHCMKLSISDCRDRKLMPSSMLQSLEMSAKTIEDEMKRQCVTEVPTQPPESTNAGVNVKTSTSKSLVTESLITPKLPVSTGKVEVLSLIEVKCEELQSCAQQAIGIGRLLASNQNDAACRAMTLSYQCLKSSVLDCRERSLLDDSTLHNLEMTYMSMEDQISTVCPTSSESLEPVITTLRAESSTTQADLSTPLVQTSSEKDEADFKCDDMQECGEKASDIAQFLSSGQTDAACSAMSDAYQCLKSAVSDCRDRNVMDEPTLQNLEMTSLNLENQISTMCSIPAPENPEPTVTSLRAESSTTYSDLSTTLVAQGTSEKEEKSSVANFKCEDMQECGEKASGIAQLLSSGQTDAACSAMSDAYQCLKSAVSDCRDRNLMDEATIQSLQMTSLNMENQISTMCSIPTPETASTTLRTDRSMTHSDLSTTPAAEKTSVKEEKSSAHNFICEDMQICGQKANDIAQLFSSSQMDAACSAMRDAYHCLKSAVSDCQDRNLIDESTLDSLQMASLNLENQISTMCSTSAPESLEPVTLAVESESSTTQSDPSTTLLAKTSPVIEERTSSVANFKCLDMQICGEKANGVEQLLSSGQMDMACSAMSDAYRCLKSAISDCRNRNIMDESTLDNLEVASLNLEDQISTLCSTASSESIGSSTTATKVSTLQSHVSDLVTDMRNQISTERNETSNVTSLTSVKMESTDGGPDIENITATPFSTTPSPSISTERENSASVATVTVATVAQSSEWNTDSHDSNTTVEGNTDSPNTSLYSVSSGIGELTAMSNVKCEAVMSCTADGLTISDLLSSKQLEAACRLMSNAYHCLKSAITDCRDRGMLHEEILASLEMAQKNLADEITKACPTLPAGQLRESMDYNTTVIGNTDIPTTPLHTISPETGESTAMKTTMAEANDFYTNLEENTTFPSVSSEAEESTAVPNVKCEGIMSCTADGEDISELLSSFQFEAACRLMSKARMCLSSAISDCKNRGMLGDDALESVESGLSVLVETLNKTCPSHLIDTSQENVEDNATVFEKTAVSISPSSSVLPQEGGDTASLYMRCEEIASCVGNMSNIEDLISSGQFSSLCRQMSGMYQCFKAALSDCESRGLMTEETLKSLDTSQREMENQMKTFCPSFVDVTSSNTSSILTEDVSSIPQEPKEKAAFMDAKCGDIMICAKQVEQLGKEASTGQLDKFCRSIPSARHCLQSAVSDCRKSGLMPEEAIQIMENSFQVLEQQVETFCSAEYSGSSESGLMSTVASTVPGRETTSPFINATCRDIGLCTNNMVPLDEMATSGQYDKLCRSIVDIRQCLISAVSDCRSSGLMPEETLQSIENDFNSMEKQFETFCPPQHSDSSPTMQVSVTSNEDIGNNEVKSTSGTVSLNLENENSSVLMNAQCGDLTTCVEQMGPLEELASSKQFEKLCRSMSNVRQCLHSAMSDCRDRGLMPEEELQSIQNDFDFVEGHFETFCSSHSGSLPNMLTTKDVNMKSTYITSSTPAETEEPSPLLRVKCEDAMQCLVDSSQIGELVTSGQRDVACNLMANAGLCVKSVLADCRSRGIMISSTLESIEMSYNTMESQMRRFCQGAAAGLDDIISPTGYIPTRDTTVDVQMTAESGKTTRKAGHRYKIDINCEALPSCSMDSALIDVLRQSGQTDVICSVMRNAKSCMESALLDCKRRLALSNEEIQNTEQSIKALESKMISTCPLSSPDLMQGHPGK